MGSTSSETPPSSSARRTDQETSDQKEPNRSSTCGNEAFLFNCFKPKPKLTRDSNSDSDEVDKFTRFINDDMEFISKVSEKLGEYEDEIQELKRRFNELLIMAKNTTTDDYHVVGLASELYFLQGKVTNLKERLSAKESEAKALRKMIDADQGFISKVSDKTQMYKETKESVKERLPNLGEYGGTVVQLRDLKKKVTKEKQRITSKQKDGSKEEEEEEEEEEPESTRYDQSRSHVTGTASTKGGHAALEQMPNLSKSFALAESSVFKDFEARYYELRIELRQCLLCFSVFPENAKINKRVMTYWWIGEGFVPPLWSEVSVPPSNKKQNNHNSSSKTAEDYANDFFYELIAKDFIAPSSKSSPGLASLVGVKTCKMNPFVRSMVIVLAKRVKFFDFDDDVNVTSDYTSSHRACLTGTRGQLEAKLPTRLEKLDLQCFPDNKDTEDWLKSGNLPNLKKLYIRGGKCFDLGANSGAGDEGKGTKQPDPKEWQVEVLRLKYLADLKMEWKQLQSLFPNLSYLETVDCPKLSFFPCDEKGVWIKKSIKS